MKIISFELLICILFYNYCWLDSEQVGGGTLNSLIEKKGLEEEERKRKEAEEEARRKAEEEERLEEEEGIEEEEGLEGEERLRKAEEEERLEEEEGIEEEEGLEGEERLRKAEEEERLRKEEEERKRKEAEEEARRKAEEEERLRKEEEERKRKEAEEEARRKAEEEERLRKEEEERKRKEEEENYMTLINRSVQYITKQNDPSKELTKDELERLKKNMEYVSYKVKVEYHKYFTEKELEMDAAKFTLMCVQGVRSPEMRGEEYVITIGELGKLKLLVNIDKRTAYLIGENGKIDESRKNPWPDGCGSRLYKSLGNKLHILYGNKNLSGKSFNIGALVGKCLIDEKYCLTLLVYVWMAGSVVGYGTGLFSLKGMYVYSNQVKMLMPSIAGSNKDFIDFKKLPKRYYLAPVTIHMLDRNLVDEAWGDPGDNRVFNVWLYLSMCIVDNVITKDKAFEMLKTFEKYDVHDYMKIANDDNECKESCAQKPRSRKMTEGICSTKSSFEKVYGEIK